MSPVRRFVVIGAGAVGSVLAAQLTLAGRPTVLVARGEQLAAVRERGLTIRRPATTDVVAVDVVDGPGGIDLRHDDVLVLATKSQDAAAALAEWAWRPVLDAAGASTLLGADLPIVTLQNGLATERAALRRFRAVYGASIGIAASYLIPGEVVSPSFPVIGVVWIGRAGVRSAAGRAGADGLGMWLAREFTAAGYLATEVDDIAAWKARKLLLNLGNAFDVFRADAAEREEARAIVTAEGRAVLVAAGVPVAEPKQGSAPLDVQGVPGHSGGRLSTWQSFARGTSSEIDHLNGEIVLLGREHGVPTPLNERLQRALGALAANGGPPGLLRLGDVLAEHRGAGAGAGPGGEARAAARAEPHEPAEAPRGFFAGVVS